MADMVGNKASESSAFVFDLLSNSSVRFEQFYGSTALPFKSNGRFHLGGRVTATPLVNFRNVIELILPIFKAEGSRPCIIIPPLPRYIFLRCCSDKGHCTNANEKDCQGTMLSGFIKQRNELIKILVESGLKDFKVLDTCCVTACQTTAGISERLQKLRKVMSEDGVHFSEHGYSNLANRSISCLKTIMTDRTKSHKKQAFWRGFQSVHGSSVARGDSTMTNRGGSIPPGSVFSGRARGVKRGPRSRFFHPYTRW
jgi:hypothetical protein